MKKTTDINPLLTEYAKSHILPQYESNESGHGIEHINYVLRRCFIFATQFDDINYDMLYTIAIFHNIAHHIDKNNHETLSAEMFMEDDFIKSYFSDGDRIIIKEAIEDHRASATSAPRSDYGKIISSADRSTDLDEFLRRTHSYTMKHFSPENIDEIVDRAYGHSQNKYGSNGYAKHYLKDEEYDDFLNKIRALLKDKEQFTKYYRQITGI